MCWIMQFGDGRLAIWYPNGTYKQVSSEPMPAHPQEADTPFPINQSINRS